MRDYEVYPHKILSMLPPGEWVARFDGNGKLQPLVCWALVELSDGKTAIKGMISAEYQQIIPCDCFPQFLCYVPTQMPTSTHEI
jgi:hypothetical protein